MMRKAVSLMMVMALCLAVLVPLAAAQGSSNSGMNMMPPQPSEKSLALQKFFSHDVTWKGTAPAGAMGPDSPAMPAVGSAKCQPMYGGFWYSCDVQCTIGTGDNAMTWKGTMTVGWDPTTSSYRGVTVDNMGKMSEYHGTLKGNTLVLETPNPVPMNGGQMAKDRLTFEWTGPESMKLTEETQATGGEWKVFQTGDMKIKGGGKAG